MTIFKPSKFACRRAATVCFIAGIVVVDYVLWLGLIFVAAGLFAIFETICGWCIVRACGIKTKF